MDPKWIEILCIAIGTIGGWAANIAYLKAGQRHISATVDEMKGAISRMEASIVKMESRVEVSGSQFINLVMRVDETAGGVRRIDHKLADLEKKEAVTAVKLEGLLKSNDNVVTRLMEMHQDTLEHFREHGN